MRKLKTWREYLIKQLAEDWDAALDYIQFAMEEYQVDGDTEVFLLALYTFVESQGGAAEVAKRTAIAPETLSKTLSVVDTSVTPIEGTASNMELVAGQLPKSKDLGLCEA